MSLKKNQKYLLLRSNPSCYYNISDSDRNKSSPEAKQSKPYLLFALIVFSHKPDVPVDRYRGNYYGNDQNQSFHLIPPAICDTVRFGLSCMHDIPAQEV